jgi:hypothetical protein
VRLGAAGQGGQFGVADGDVAKGVGALGRPTQIPQGCIEGVFGAGMGVLDERGGLAAAGLHRLPAEVKARIMRNKMTTVISLITVSACPQDIPDDLPGVVTEHCHNGESP